jgi:hypothetical protein
MDGSGPFSLSHSFERHLRAKNLSDGTVASYLVGVRQFTAGEIAVNPMARMKPPMVPDKPFPVVPEDALRRLLAACAGKGFEARRDTASSPSCWTPAPAAATSPACGSSTSTSIWASRLSWARAAGNVPCRSGARRRWPWSLPPGPVSAGSPPEPGRMMDRWRPL